MQKSILLFLCAVSGTLLAGCYENDSSGPDMVDPWLRERTPLGFRVESQVGEAVITDDWATTKPVRSVSNWSRAE